MPCMTWAPRPTGNASVESVNGLGSFSVPHQHRLRPFEDRRVREDDPLPGGETVDDLDLRNARRPRLDVADRRHAAVDDVRAAPGARLEKGPAGDLQDVHALLENDA